jgi:hypothetical protein
MVLLSPLYNYLNIIPSCKFRTISGIAINFAPTLSHNLKKTQNGNENAFVHCSDCHAPTFPCPGPVLGWAAYLVVALFLGLSF